MSAVSGRLVGTTTPLSPRAGTDKAGKPYRVRPRAAGNRLRHQVASQLSNQRSSNPSTRARSAAGSCSRLNATGPAAGFVVRVAAYFNARGGSVATLASAAGRDALSLEREPGELVGDLATKRFSYAVVGLTPRHERRTLFPPRSAAP